MITTAIITLAITQAAFLTAAIGATILASKG